MTWRWRWFFAVILQLSIPVNEALKCPGTEEQSIYDFFDNCLYVVPIIIHDSSHTFNYSEKECSFLNQHPYMWGLPTLDNLTKNSKLFDVMKKAMTTDPIRQLKRDKWSIWIGLVRDYTEDVEQLTKMKKWQDKSKWRWTVDKTTLNDSYPGRIKPPWREEQPDNEEYVGEGHPGEYHTVERYVKAEVLQASETMATWSDYDPDNWETTELFLLCESRIVPEPVAPFKEPIDTMNPENVEKKSSWQWVFMGFALLMMITGITVLVMVIISRRKVSWNAKKPVRKFQPPRRRVSDPGTSVLTTVSEVTTATTTTYGGTTTRTTNTGAYDNLPSTVSVAKTRR